MAEEAFLRYAIGVDVSATRVQYQRSRDRRQAEYESARRDYRNAQRRVGGRPGIAPSRPATVPYEDLRRFYVDGFVRRYREALQRVVPRRKVPRGGHFPLAESFLVQRVDNGLLVRSSAPYATYVVNGTKPGQMVNWLMAMDGKFAFFEGRKGVFRGKINAMKFIERGYFISPGIRPNNFFLDAFNDPEVLDWVRRAREDGVDLVPLTAIVSGFQVAAKSEEFDKLSYPYSNANRSTMGQKLYDTRFPGVLDTTIRNVGEMIRGADPYEESRQRVNRQVLRDELFHGSGVRYGIGVPSGNPPIHGEES